MEVECYRVQLKPDSNTLLNEWAARLNGELDSVKELLRKEGVTVESVFLEETTEGSFLIYYLRAYDLKKARAVSKQSQHPLDKFHQDVMSKIAMEGTRLTCLLDASTDS